MQRDTSRGAKRIMGPKIMNKRTCLLAALLGALGLALLFAKPLSRSKARAQRIQAVNNFARPFPERTFTFVLTNPALTNMAPQKTQ